MDAHANLAISAVATAPSPAASGTSLVVTAGQGSRFPAVPFNATVWPATNRPDPSNAEIVRVTAVSTDTLTITRAQESTSARTIVAGDLIANTVTAKALTDLEVVDAAAGTGSLRTIGKTSLKAADGADTEYAFSQFKVVRESITLFASGAAAQTLLMWPGNALALGVAGSASAVLRIEPTDFSGGPTRTAKMKVRCRVVTNAVAPAVNFVVHLYPVATLGGASNVRASVATVGTSLGNAAVNAPGASASTYADSAVFDVPAAGYYVLAIVSSGTTATNSQTEAYGALMVQQV